MNNLNNNGPKGFSIFFIVGLISTILAFAIRFSFDYLGIFLELWQLIFIASFSLSLLFTIASYYLINRSITYAVKTIITTLVVTSTALFVFFYGIFIIIRIIPLVPPILLPIILIAIGFIALKKHAALYAALNNTQKAFAVSFTASILVYGALMTIILILLYSAGGLYINIDEIDAPAGENITYVEITKEELEEYPAVGKAINSYLETNEQQIKIDHKDEGQVKDFFEKKRYESVYLFSIMDAGAEEDLNKNIISDELRNIFESNGFTISENVYANVHISQVSKSRWYIVERDERTYEILKEEGSLNVYDRESRYGHDKIFKIGELYFKVNFICAD